MIVVRVFGGLGNQMFQYAFAKYLGLNNKEVYLDITDFKTHIHHYGFELDKVFSNLDYNLIEGKQLDKVRFNPNTVLNRVLNKAFGVQIVRNSEYREQPAKSVIKNNTYRKDIYFNGFWGNLQYINEVEDLLRKELVFRYLPEGKNRELLDFLEGKISVSVHVRRGDYLQEDGLKDAFGIAFYKEAFNIFMEKYSEVVFVIFSDDIPWVKENFDFSRNMIFVDWNRGKESYIDMLMMSLCNHNIIANSTFSWWSAWLNSNKDKCVIAPRYWRSNDKNESSLYPGDWILL